MESSIGHSISLPIRLFYSYSHRDEEMRDELEAHLQLLKPQGCISDWHDRKITSGEEWKGEIDENLDGADIILLLVSAYFTSSDYCWDVELDTAMRRHEEDDAVVIPIFLRPCDTHDAPFMKLQGLPINAKPVSSWSDPHEAWKIIADGIRSAIESWVKRHEYGALENKSIKSSVFFESNLKPLPLKENMSLHYLEYFSSLPFIDLLHNTAAIENKIIDDIIFDIETALISAGFNKCDNGFKNQHKLVKFSTHLIPCPAGNSLTIVFEATPSKKWIEPASIEIKEFGKIREIHIVSSYPTPIILENLSFQLLARLKTAYSALERTFLRKVCEVNKTAFSDVFDLLTIQLKSYGKDHLLGRFCLIVATDDFVLYFFDETELRRIINRYKDVDKTAALGISPFELTSIILTETFPFQKTLALKALRLNQTLSLPWVKSEYLEEAPLIHKAEELLYDSDDYSAYVPCVTRDHYLIVGCPTEFADDLMPVVISIQKNLCHTFGHSLSDWSAYIIEIVNDLSK